MPVKFRHLQRKKYTNSLPLRNRQVEDIKSIYYGSEPPTMRAAAGASLHHSAIANKVNEVVCEISYDTGTPGPTEPPLNCQSNDKCMDQIPFRHLARLPFMRCGSLSSIAGADKFYPILMIGSKDTRSTAHRTYSQPPAAQFDTECSSSQI